MLDRQNSAQDVIGFVVSENVAGRRCALLILDIVRGGTLRARGALMAVSENADVRGYISAGCVDGDLVAQASMAFKDNKMRRVCYGAGSPYKDISLPCGGHIEILICPAPDIAVLREIQMRLSKRETAQLYVSKSGDIALDAASDDEAAFSYPPRLRLRIAGRGAPLFSLARQTMSAGFDVIVQSPDISDFPVAEFMHLRNPAHPPAIRDDARTAFVMLFHNHEWEDALLEQALAGPAFYIGAMGSAQTHAARLDKLRSAGISDADCARIKGPIGLIAALRDADLLALSVLAEITQIAGVNELL